MPEPALGVNYPIRRSEDGYFDKTFTTVEHVKANLINVLSTSRGERVMRPDFGTRLEEFLFEPMTPQTEAEIQGEIEDVAERFLPYVTIESIEINQFEEEGVVRLEVRFSTFFLPDDEEENVEIFFELSEQSDS